VRVYYLPWWGLLACLAASALAVYLVLGRTQAGNSPWALFPLTAALAPVMLLAAMVTAITLSTLLSAFLEGRTGPPPDPSEPPAQTEHTGSEVTPEATAPADTLERKVPAMTASPSASSPSVSPSASASLPASPSASPSPSTGARTPPR
jgi:hypothetical protein